MSRRFAAWLALAANGTVRAAALSAQVPTPIRSPKSRLTHCGFSDRPALQEQDLWASLRRLQPVDQVHLRGRRPDSDQDRRERLRFDDQSVKRLGRILSHHGGAVGRQFLQRFLYAAQPLVVQ